MNRKNFLKNKKINWIKVVIQILSFALIPGLFEGEFAAKILFAYTRKYFMGKCEVFGMDAVGNCAGNSTCGKVFLWIFLQFWSSAGFAMAWITDCGHYFREKET